MSIGIVGGGPTGILTATLLASTGKSVKLFQKGNLGGNHRVDWVGPLSTQFARVYSNGYVNYIEILRYLEIDFYEYYERGDPYIVFKVMKDMPLGPLEIVTMLNYYVYTLVLPDRCKRISMKCISSNFKQKSKIFIDQMCKILDGVGFERLSCWSFFSILNVIHTQYHPSKSSDVLWNKILDKFKEFNGEIVPENVSKIVDFGIQTTGGTNWYFSKIVLCTPPKATLEIMRNSTSLIRDAIMPLDELEIYTFKSSYPVWIQFTIHFNHHVKMKKPDFHDLLGKEWCILSLVLSDHIKTKGTLITCCTSTLDKISETGLIANEIENSDVLLREASRQVLKRFSISEEPDNVVLNPKVTRENGRWMTNDIPFVFSYETSAVTAKTDKKNLFWVGQQNGHGTFGVTTLETVSENVIPFCLQISPTLEISKKGRYTFSRLIVFLMLLFFYLYTLYKSK